MLTHINTSGRLVSGLAILVFVAGCTARSPTSDGNRDALVEPVVTATPEISPGMTVRLPLQEFTVSGEQAALIARAEGIIAETCMRRLGFDWHSATDAAPERLGAFEGLGIVDEWQAARFGYHPVLPPGSGQLRTTEPSLQERAERAALSGADAATVLPGAPVPSYGCLGDARQQVWEGQPAHDEELVSRLASQAADATERDSRFMPAVAAWSACMMRAGFGYATPWEAQYQLWADEPTRSEIATATQDAICKRETNLAGIWLALISGYQGQLVVRHRVALEQVRRAADYVAARAAEIVRAGDDR